MLENSKNVGNFCEDEKLFAVEIFFEFFLLSYNAPLPTTVKDQIAILSYF